MLSREEIQGRLIDKVEKQRAKVDKDNKGKSTEARIAKLNVLDYMLKYLKEERDTNLRTLQDVVSANPLYDKNTFFQSATEILLHEVITFRAGEDKEKEFVFKLS